MNMVSSRPILSDTQPKNGLVTPFSTRSIDSANVNAGIVMKRSVTGVLATPKSVAITESCAVAISPARAHQHKHQVHHPETTGIACDLRWAVVAGQHVK